VKKIFGLSFLVLILLLGFPSLVLAAGDGSGGEDKAFDIVSSTVENGEEDVNIDREIKFVFSKNVANISVAENNRQCFSMTDSGGNAVPIEVITFDDQLEREKRNDIIVKPGALKEAEEYTITISPDLQSKSGETLGKEIKYTFSTPGFAAAETTGSSAPADGDSSQWLIYVVVLVVVIAAAIYFFKKKNNAQ